VTFVETIWQDIVFALRAMRKIQFLLRRRWRLWRLVLERTARFFP